MSGLDSYVNNEMNHFISMSFTTLEVKEVLFYMGASKSLSLDGLLAFLYQKYWNIVGDDIIRQC